MARRKKKEPRTWPAGPTAGAYLKNLKEQIDARWQRALSMCATEAGVPVGTKVTIGEDGLWHEVIKK